MENENSRVEVNNNLEEDMTQDYISAINEMKANTVSKDSYLKLKEENQKLINSLVKGGTIQIQAEGKPDVNELRKKLFSKSADLSNLDYVETALNLRNTLIEKGEKDPFLPCGKDYIPTENDVATANRVADILQECVDYAEGNSEIFTNEVARRTVDTAPIRRK